MTKTFTLENVLTQSQEKKENESKQLWIPEPNTVKMLIRYSMALQVVRTRLSGDCFLILN